MYDPGSFIKLGHWFRNSPSKRKEYTSPFNIKAVVETRPHQLNNLLYFSPAIPSLTVYGPPSPDLREVLRYTYF